MGRELLKSPALRLTSTLAPTTSRTDGSPFDLTEIRSVIIDPRLTHGLTKMTTYRIVKKLDAHNRTEAIAIAMREGFIH